MTGTELEGLVLKNYSGFFYVQDAGKNVYECKLRGKIKERILSGDRVMFTCREEGQGILEKRLPRQNELYRPRIANVSAVLIIMAVNQPVPSLMLLDRLLFLASYNKLIPQIVLNKCDLSWDEKAKVINDYYPQNGFNLIVASAKEGLGVEALKQAIRGEIAVLAGPSGVGKSSLLNSLGGGRTAATQEVSHKIGRGKHTTRHVELYPLDSGGWIADTPGFSVLDMPPLKREELGDYFPDFALFREQCKYSNCLHYRETECGVKMAVAEKCIVESRYNNYLAMLEEVMKNERCYK